MKVDLDRHAEETLDENALAERRLLLTDQLDYLIAEAAALEPLLAQVPDELLTTAPLPGASSAFEILWRIGKQDSGERLPHIEAHGTGSETVEVQAAGDLSVANEKTREEVIAHVRASRQRLLDAVKALPASGWERPVAGEPSLYAYLLSITQEDADRLREIAYRLYESHLSNRK